MSETTASRQRGFGRRTAGVNPAARWGLIVCGIVLSCAGAFAGVGALLDDAREHLQKGRVDEALDAYDELERKGTDKTALALGRSACFEARGEWRLAAETLSEALKDGENAALAARLAAVHFAQGEFDEAAAQVANSLELDPDQPEAHLVQADLWAATGKLKQAENEYRWFVRYYNRAQPADADTLLVVARGATQYARWTRNSQIFEFVVNTLLPDALKADKNCWQAYYQSGALLIEKYNRAEAMPEFKRALAINPRAAEVHAALAESSLQEFNLAEAARHAERALEINPHLIAALLVRADLELEDGNLRQAREIAEEALSVNPHDERALARIAACNLLEDGPPPPAELDELFGNLDAIGDVKIDKPSRFGKLLIELARRDSHPGVFLSHLGEKLEARKRFELAERCYRQAMVSMPQLAAPKSALGMLSMRVGRNDEAARILDQAFEADPYHVRVSNMRKVLKLLGGYETIASDHFVIRVDAADRILGRYMSEYLEEQYPALVAQFGFAPPVRTQFEIFQKAKGLSAHQWFSARMVGLPWVQTIGASTGMIVALTSPTASEKPYNWARVVKHEFVHILTLQQTRFNIPHWFTEALAVMSEGYPPPEQWNRLLLERVPKGDVMNLDNINLGFIRPKGPDDWNMAYCQSRLYALYIVDNYGPESIPRLLEAFRDNLPIERAISKVLGVDRPTFEEGYRKSLDELVSRLQAIQPETPLTLAEAEKAHLAQPDDPHAKARYALSLFTINRRKDARRLAQEALDRNRNEPLAALVLAQLELRSEDIPAAIKWLEPALNRQKPHPQVLGLLAELMFKQERYGDAIALYDLGLAYDPDRVSWLKGLAAALIKSQQVGRLKPVLEKLSLADGDDAGVRQKLAQMALAEKDYTSALRYARMALEIDVMDAVTHRLAAQAHMGLSQHDAALRECLVAIELQPDDSNLVVEAARAEAAGGKKEAAVARLKELLQNAEFAPAQGLLRELQGGR